MNLEIQNLDLDTIPGSPEEKAHWAKTLREECEAKERHTKYQEAKTRIENLKETIIGIKSELEKDLPEILLRWATGGPYKEVTDTRRSIGKYQDQLADCEAASTVLVRKTPITKYVQHADIARNQIRRALELKKAQDEEKKV